MMRIAIINERWTAGSTRCARDLQRGLESAHAVRYFPESPLTPEGQLEQLQIFRPDVVHLHSYYSDLPYSFLADVAERYPTILTPHDPRPIGNMMLECWNCEEYGTCFQCPIIKSRLQRYTLIRHPYYRWRKEKRRIHDRLPAATAFVCVSEWMRRRLLTTELKRFRVERIYNGVDLERFRRVAGARESLGFAADAKIILYVAHHNGWVADERKGGHVLARALGEVVVPRFPEVVVLAAGGGMIPNIPNVRPLGFIDQQEISRYYSAADIFVAPSLAENLPYTILEAMGCGVPVVASRVGGIPEEIDDGKTGKLFAQGSWQELGAALNELLANPDQARALGSAGRERAKDMFGLQTFVDKYEQLYAKVSR